MAILPNDEAATKLFDLAPSTFSWKWQRVTQAWRDAIPALAMLFADRFKGHT